MVPHGEVVKHCKLCIIPDTRPDTAFVDGVCSACIAYAKRPTIDWTARKEQLLALLARAKEKARARGNAYDCIVPSSGGKDSHAQVLTLLELGARPLAVTATTCHLTEIGRRNLDNLARYATTIEVSPNRAVREKLNRLGLTMVGDISYPEHVSIFTVPFKIAIATGIPFIFWGENPQSQYGGPLDEQDAKMMTQRWVSEFGGFLGLRAQDLIGVDGLTETDLQDYMQPDWEKAAKIGLEAHFLGQYLPWDSHANAKRARQAGMVQKRPAWANWWHHENLDNAQTGLHDHLMYRKFGYGRGAAQMSVDIRIGRIDRAVAMRWAEDCDGTFPHWYGGVSFDQMLERIGLDEERAMELIDRFTNWTLFEHERWRPILKDRWE